MVNMLVLCIKLVQWSSIKHGKYAFLQVQILVHVRPADRPGAPHFELLECQKDTRIAEIKAKACLPNFSVEL